jgi:hypothetical protein
VHTGRREAHPAAEAMISERLASLPGPGEGPTTVKLS